MLEMKCTNAKLRRFTRQVGRLYDAELGKVGLTGTQFALLSEVKRAGSLRPGELANRMAMDASTLTRNLKPLERQGWVTVTPGKDRRSRCVAITGAGEAARVKAHDEWGHAQAHLRARLGEVRHEHLNRVLDEAFTLLSQPPANEAD